MAVRNLRHARSPVGRLAPRGYYIIAGDNGGFTQSGPGQPGLVIDTGPAGLPRARLKFWWPESRYTAAAATAAMELKRRRRRPRRRCGERRFPCNLTLDLTGAGYPVGCCFAAGGGGRWGNPVGGGDGGGGGASGWNAGHGLDAGNAGQVYDPNNGGTAPAFPNGGGGGSSGAGGGDGGGLGLPGEFGDNGTPLIYPNGPAGLAVKRSAAGATTTINGTTSNLRGVVRVTQLRRMWTEEEVRQMVRDELTSPFVLQRVREAARAEATKRAPYGRAPSSMSPWARGGAVRGIRS